MPDYFKLLQVLGFNASLFNNGLSYQDFLGGAYISAFDLSKSMEASNDFLRTQARLGHLRLHVEFSRELPENLTMLVMKNFNALIEINHGRGISCSYINQDI